jgi:hypothetical protein
VIGRRVWKYLKIAKQAAAAIGSGKKEGSLSTRLLGLRRPEDDLAACHRSGKS